MPRRLSEDRRLMPVRALVSEIATLEPGLLAQGEGSAIAEAVLTSTGVAVVRLAARGDAGVVVKLSTTRNAAARLKRETMALRALCANDQLGPWRRLVPRVYADGWLRGHCYRVESAVIGRSAVPSRLAWPDRRAVLTAAAGTIELLHRRTASAVDGDPALAWRWVDVHVAELMRHAGRGSALVINLERLRDELHDFVAEGTFSAGWIHGDYWLGNLMFAQSDAASAELAGIVDWDASGPLELPLHDVLHLALFTRRRLSGRELGHIVADLLLHDEWSHDERWLLDRYASWRLDGSLSDRHALLLYWLRHAAMHTRQQTEPAGYRYRLWFRRNVVPVVASL